MTFIAEETREILARLGVRSLDEVIGRTELLRQVSRGAEHLDDLDLNPILAKVDAPDHHRRFTLNTFRNEVPDSLDADMIRDAKAVFERGEKMRSEEHTSELQSLMRISYAVSCSKKNNEALQLPEAK